MAKKTNGGGNGNSFREALSSGDTQLFKYIEEMEDGMEDVMKQVATQYIADECQRADKHFGKLIGEEEDRARAEKRKPDLKELKAKREAYKKRAKAISSVIFRSVQLVRKVHEGPDKKTPFILAPFLPEEETILQKDPIMPLLYFTLELPANLSRDKFIAVANEKFNCHLSKEKSPAGREESDFTVVSDRDIEKVPMRKFIIPFRKVAFPTREREQEIR